MIRMWWDLWAISVRVRHVSHWKSRDIFFRHWIHVFWSIFEVAGFFLGSCLGVLGETDSHSAALWNMIQTSTGNKIQAIEAGDEDRSLHYWIRARYGLFVDTRPPVFTYKKRTNGSHGPVEIPVEIVDLPIRNGGSFHSYVNVYQRVCVFLVSAGLIPSGYD